MQILGSAVAVLVLSSAAFAIDVPDNGSDVAYQNTGTVDHTVVITNTGNDTVYAVVKNAGGDILGWVKINPGDAKPSTSPPGGSTTVDDKDYSGTQTNPTITNDSNTSKAEYTVTP